MKEVIYLEKSKREVLNAKVAEREEELSFFGYRPRLFAFRPSLLDRGKQADPQRRKTLNEKLSAADRPCEEGKQADDVENHIRAVLRPLIRFVKDFAERQQSDGNDNCERDAVG